MSLDYAVRYVPPRSSTFCGKNAKSAKLGQPPSIMSTSVHVHSPLTSTFVHSPSSTSVHQSPLTSIVHCPLKCLTLGA